MARYYDTQPTAPVFAGVTWFERYGCYRTNLNKWLELAFSYEAATEKDEAGYKISVAGRKIKAKGKDPEDAARIAMRAARLWCANILKEFPEEKQ